MGWNRANEIFDPVCKALQQSFLVPEARQKVLVTLIKGLQDCDWDTEDESLELFKDDPAVVKAFKECGVYLWGTPEYDIENNDNSVSQKMMEAD